MDQHDAMDPKQQTAEHTSPFEEPAEAPELRDERSENLYRKSEPFWSPIVGEQDPRQPVRRPDSYWEHPEVMEDTGMMTVVSHHPWKRFVRFLGSGTAKKLVAVVMVLCVAAFILQGALLRLKTIEVVGNEHISDAEIIRLSGLKLGQSTWSLDDEEVMHRVQGNRYLRCTLVDVTFSTVTIHVRERIPAAYIDTAGMRVVMDNRGFVLEESYTTDADMSQMVLVKGMQVSHVNPGQTIILKDEKQLALYQQTMIELAAMGHPDLLVELDMSQMDSIYLTTRDGYRVCLGKEDKVHQKLRAFLITRDRLIEMGEGTGAINVSDPGRPTFLRAQQEAAQPENEPLPQ